VPLSVGLEASKRLRLRDSPKIYRSTISLSDIFTRERKLGISSIGSKKGFLLLQYEKRYALSRAASRGPTA
jgi:hypothetical protein